MPAEPHGRETGSQQRGAVTPCALGAGHVLAGHGEEAAEAVAYDHGVWAAPLRAEATGGVVRGEGAAACGAQAGAESRGGAGIGGGGRLWGEGWGDVRYDWILFVEAFGVDVEGGGELGWALAWGGGGRGEEKHVGE